MRGRPSAKGCVSRARLGRALLPALVLSESTQGSPPYLLQISSLRDSGSNGEKGVPGRDRLTGPTLPTARPIQSACLGGFLRGCGTRVVALARAAGGPLTLLPCSLLPTSGLPRALPGLLGELEVRGLFLLGASSVLLV